MDCGPLRLNRFYCPILFCVYAASIILAIVLAVIPPLSDEQQRLVGSAFDGRGHEEPAIWALLENTALWTGETGDAPIRLTPDIASMLEHPDAYRGDLCRIEGYIAQIEPLRSPYVGIEGWFIRTDGDVPVLVYVDFRNGRGAPERPFRISERVSIDARFYKRVDRLDRENRPRSYAALVGAYPRRVLGVTAFGSDMLGVVAAIIGGLGAIFLVLFVWARRVGRSDVRRTSIFTSAGEEYPVLSDLPNDPADAMNVLRSRAEGDD